MRAEYTYDYHHTRCTDECESIEEAAGRAYADDAQGTAIPIRITADGKTVWKHPAHPLADCSEELLKLANYPAPERGSAP